MLRAIVLLHIIEWKHSTVIWTRKSVCVPYTLLRSETIHSNSWIHYESFHFEWTRWAYFLWCNGAALMGEACWPLHSWSWRLNFGSWLYLQRNLRDGDRNWSLPLTNRSRKSSWILKSSLGDSWVLWTAVSGCSGFALLLKLFLTDNRVVHMYEEMLLKRHLSPSAFCKGWLPPCC